MILEISGSGEQEKAQIKDATFEIETMFDNMMAVCLEYGWRTEESLRNLHEKKFLQVYRDADNKRQRKIEQLRKQEILKHGRHRV